MRSKWTLFSSITLLCSYMNASEDLSNASLDGYLNQHGFFLSPVHSQKNEGYSSALQRMEFLHDLQKYSQINTILEIGFNAGHSSEVFLNSTNCQKLVSFDINTHPYVRVGVDFLRKKFGNRFEFVAGNSLTQVPAYATTHPHEKFDLIFIDGGHSFECCTGDIRNCQQFAHKNTILWIDDYAPWGVKGPVDFCVDEGLITLIEAKSVDDVSGNRAWAIARYSSDAERTFRNIYKHGLWGKDQYGNGTSGPGSTLQQAQAFVDYLQMFLNAHPEVHSVLDIGCGDWALAREIHWGDRNYLGIDVVDFLMKQNQAKYGSDKVRFSILDITSDELPPADLLICKDVLIHFPNAEIAKLLSQTKKFKYCLFVNDVPSPVGPHVNQDISLGAFHTVDLTGAPFFLRPEAISYYRATPYAIKQLVLLKSAS